MLSKQPEFPKIESKWQRFWDREKIYNFNMNSNKPIYSIDTPPVYASAAHLHVGHALHYTQFEFMARFWRMNGREVYFPPCYDNNGLPTEKYVEEKYKLSKGDMPRAKFRALCRKEAAKIEKDYSERVFKRLGHSYDWNLLYTTIDPQSQKICQTSFLDLVKKSHAYRAEEPVLWCPHHETALAQAEVEDKERKTKLNYIYFNLDGGGKIEIATTRPELLPACVGVFVNPKDKRYTNLIGKKAIVPLFGYKVPIMADDKVDKDFGSGVVMICTFGDSSDIEWWKKHKLPLRLCITEDGKLNERCGKYTGLPFKTARQAILDDLNDKKYLTKQEQIEQNVGVCWRCGTPIEFFVAKQWFIKTLKFKKQIIAQARKINWHLPFYRKRLEDWTRNLGWDWTISRQRYYGVPIPVWYCKKCDKPMFADSKDLPVDPTTSKPKNKCSCGSNEFRPDDDVFDTWMTSSMTPQLACQWLKNDKLYKRLYPMSLRPQSHDIIRTWSFYTILKSYLHFKSIPWTDVMIGTYILDSKGKGMHKSKGNVIRLDDMLNKYPVDAIRYWAATVNIGEDVPFIEKEFTRGSKVLIKLWNTARFAEMWKFTEGGVNLQIADKWILSRLRQVMGNYIKFFENHEIAKARKELEMFFFNEFADYYLEMIKYRLYSKDPKQMKGAIWTLYVSLFDILQMWAPFLPHTTEEIYQTLLKNHVKAKSIHTTQLDFKKRQIDFDALTLGKTAIDVIAKIKQYKQKKGLNLGAELDNLTISSSKHKDLEKLSDLIAGTMRVKNLTLKKGVAFTKLS